jgi:hypothetical protein
MHGAWAESQDTPAAARRPPGVICRSTINSDTPNVAVAMPDVAEMLPTGTNRSAASPRRQKPPHGGSSSTCKDQELDERTHSGLQELLDLRIVAVFHEIIHCLI